MGFMPIFLKNEYQGVPANSHSFFCQCFDRKSAKYSEKDKEF